MSVRHDPVLVRRLAAEIAGRTSGHRPLEIAWHRGLRAAEVAFERGPSLLLLLHPDAGHVLEVARGSLRALIARWLRGDAVTESATPRDDLELTSRSLRGDRIVGVWSPPDERLLVLELAGRGGPRRLVVELHTNQWNVLLLENGAQAQELARATRGGPDDGTGPAWGRIEAVLWPREPGERTLRPGRPYAPPAFPGGPRRWRLEGPSGEAWKGLLEEVPAGDRRRVLVREVAWTSSLNAGWILGDEEQGDALEGARQRYLTLRRAADVPEGSGGEGTPAGPSGEETGEGWLLDEPHGLQPYPLRLGRDSARPTSSLLEAFRASARASGWWAPLSPTLPEQGKAGTEAGAASSGEGLAEAVPPDSETLRLEAALEALRERLERRAAALERELSGGPDPERLREDANLLLARLAGVARGAGEVTLEGFGGEPRTLTLDPALSPSENAERLYDEAARRERAAERLPGEIRRVRERLGELEAARERLAETGPSEALWDTAGGRPSPRSKPAGQGQERLPYRTYRSSGGLEIRVGRGARQNDELTFHHSHGDDIWLHARQVPGAHVILRWGRKDENPPRRDLLEAAVAAAVHSDARHSGTVGVDWTRRKYVRSPRKAPPGVVIPERVQTVFVEPSEALLARLEPPD